MRARIEALEFNLRLQDVEDGAIVFDLMREGPVPARDEQPTVITLTGSGAVQLPPRIVGWPEIEPGEFLHIVQAIALLDLEPA